MQSLMDELFLPNTLTITEISTIVTPWSIYLQVDCGHITFQTLSHVITTPTFTGRFYQTDFVGEGTVAYSR